MGPHIIKAYKKLASEKQQTDGYIMLLLGYARPSFGDFESYLINVVGLDEGDFQNFLKQFSLFFST